MNLFVSYSRDQVKSAGIIARDLDAMGHEVWWDRDLSGGQEWWSQILAQIKQCDLFVFLVGHSSLASIACSDERSYASNLQKRILPIICEENINTAALPTDLSKIQYIIYLEESKKTTLELAKSINRLPEPSPLPALAVNEPPVPLTDVQRWWARVHAPELSVDEQAELLKVLTSAAFRDRTRHDALELLRALRGHQGLSPEFGGMIDSFYVDHPEFRNSDVNTDNRKNASGIHIDNISLISAMIKTAFATTKKIQFRCRKCTILLQPEPDSDNIWVIFIHGGVFANILREQKEFDEIAEKMNNLGYEMLSEESTGKQSALFNNNRASSFLRWTGIGVVAGGAMAAAIIAAVGTGASAAIPAALNPYLRDLAKKDYKGRFYAICFAGKYTMDIAAKISETFRIICSGSEYIVAKMK